MVMVMFEPGYWQASDEAIAADSLLSASVLEVASLEVTVAPLRAVAVK